MKKKIKLLMDWTDPEGTKHVKETVLEVDSAVADSLVLANVCEEWDEAAEKAAEKAAAEKAATNLEIQNTIKNAIKTHFDALAENGNNDLGCGLHIVVDPEHKDHLPFKSVGEQLLAIKTFSTTNGGDEKEKAGNMLAAIAKAATGSNELIDSEGGFLVQQDFMQTLDKRAVETGQLSARVDTREVSGNGLKWNELDDYNRTKGNHPVQVYWTEEAGTKTASKPTFIRRNLELEKLAGLYYATDELLEDAPALAGEVSEWFGNEFGFEMDSTIIEGSGAGQPKGILKSNALVTVAKESGQTAATVNATNVSKMFARMPSRYLGESVWLINQDVWPQLPLMTIGDQPVYLPPNGLIDAPAGMLLGRPVLMTEHCKTLGTLGDIMFVNLKQYKMIRKGGIKGASSIHVRFVNDETAFRWVLRCNGDTKWSKTMTPKNGSNSLSPFIGLATRA